MIVSELRALRGINAWNHNPAIQVLVNCEESEHQLSNMSYFWDWLRIDWPFRTPLFLVGNHDDLSLADFIAFVVLELQIQAGCSVKFSLTKKINDSSKYIIVVEYAEEAVGRLAFAEAERLCQSILQEKPSDITSVVKKMRDLYESLRLGPSTLSIVQAGVARGIPHYRLTDGSLVQLGWGSQQRRIIGSVIDKTCYIAENIVRDKELTKRLLKASGITTPQGGLVFSIEEAWTTALAIGLPVVVKPRDGNQGKGVTVNITTQEELIDAFKYALQFQEEILIERFISGGDFRLLVVGNNLVAAARRDPPIIYGDGQHTIGELIEDLNSDPRRRPGHATPMSCIEIDDVVKTRLNLHGYTLDSRLAKNESFILRNNANLSSGASATDVTDMVHPEIAALAVEAANVVGLNPCGIDFVCQNIQHPLEGQEWALIEINSSPGLRMHLSPAHGQSRPVGEAIIEQIFAPGINGRIPVIAVTGTNGKTTTVRLITHLLKQIGLRVGMTNSDGIFIDACCIEKGDCSGPKSARKVLCHPDVDAAVFETARGGLLREGLAFDACQVAVVTNIGSGDHLGLDHVNTIEELALVKRTVVRSIAENGVAILNASDLIVADMATDCKGSVIFFAMNKQLPQIISHQAKGERVVYIDNQCLVAVEGENQHHIPLEDIPITYGGSIDFQIENVMASVAAAWAVGIDWVAIISGLKTFASNLQYTPGRFNLFTYQKATIIADYAHNHDAIASLVQAVSTFDANYRTVVISAPGDRSDSAIKNMSKVLGETFDRVLLYQDKVQRGRADGEVLALLREGLINAIRTTAIEEIYGEFVAIDVAFSQLKEGDLCLILVDQVEKATQYITQLIDTAC